MFLIITGFFCYDGHPPPMDNAHKHGTYVAAYLVVLPVLLALVLNALLQFCELVGLAVNVKIQSML